MACIQLYNCMQYKCMACMKYKCMAYIQLYNCIKYKCMPCMKYKCMACMKYKCMKYNCIKKNEKHRENKLNISDYYNIYRKPPLYPTVINTKF